MLKLLSVALANDKMQAVIYTPTVTTIGIQLNYQPKGVIIDLTQVENGYSVKLFDLPAGQQQPKPVLKAMKNITGEKGLIDELQQEFALCEQIFDKYFGAEEQKNIADHVAGLLEDKHMKIAAKGK